jgi:23S rRNA (cytosine1962-C5)-methyltransferase
MVFAGAGHPQHLHGAVRVERRTAQHVAELLLADQAGARTGQEYPARLYRAEREPVHVEVFLQRRDPLLAVAERNARLNKARVRFVQADIFAWLRDVAVNNRDQYDVVVLDPAKMTRDREQVIPALKKYLDMNKLALGAVKPGGIFLTCSCTGLVSEEQFLDMLRRAAFYANRTVQVLKVTGAGVDHPWMAHVPESRYLKAAFCRVE